MIRDILSIRGAKVLHQKTGELLATLNWPIVDPDTGVIEAFWVKSMVEGSKNAIILTSTILGFKKNIYITSEKMIMDPSENVRITDILQEGRRIIEAEVKNESSKKYGKAYNFSFSTDTFVMRQLFVQRSVLGMFQFGHRIFPYERILRVLPHLILVEDDSTEKEASPAPAEPA